MRRRDFLKTASASAAGLALAGCAGASTGGSGETAGVADPLYKISLAEYSLHRALGNGEMDHLDFPRLAREEFGIGAVEYVNFFFDSADAGYVRRLKKRAADAGVRNLLIMVSREGELGAADEAARMQAVGNHKKWVEAAAELGCHSVRVDALGSGPPDAMRKQTADGLHRLCTFAEDYDTNVIVENHSEQSADGAWVAALIEEVDHPLAGTLPDFGNFCLDWSGEPWTSDCADAYDRYRGVREMMPYAEAVSAKSYAFDPESGAETNIDYECMMQIVTDHGYHGHVGIEYEGDQMPEYDGIRATKALLERTRAQFAENRRPG